MPGLLFISWADFGWMALGLFLMFNFLAIVVLSLTWLERKALGRLQRRLGPTRSGPMGLMQPVADAIKLVIKEDIIPTSVREGHILGRSADRDAFGLHDLGDHSGSAECGYQASGPGAFLHHRLLRGGHIGVGAGGWGSANKYGTLGGLRAAAQLISYEIPIIMVAVSVAMLAQSLSLREIVEQQGSYWFFLVQPLGLVIFFIAGLAEVGRTPFDIYFAESEIVGGPFVEYSGAHWSLFFLAEYINTFAIAALTVILFFGGWLGPGLSGYWAVIWFLVKVYIVILVIFWIRGTFPRLRIDQLMAFAWKVVVPLSFLVVVMTAIYQFYGWPAWSLTLMSLAGLVWVGYAIYRRMAGPASRVAQVRARQEALMASRRRRPEPVEGQRS